MDATWIEPGLWVGGDFADPGQLPPEVNVIINLRTEPNTFVPAGRLRASLWLPLEEAIPSETWLHAVTGFVAGCRVQGWNVLIHCEHGTSRAVFVGAAVLMRSHDWSRDLAVSFIRQRRPQAYPHLGFYAALGDWGRYLSTGRAA